MIRKSKFDPGIMCYEAGLDAPQSLRDTLDERGLGFALFVAKMKKLQSSLQLLCSELPVITLQLSFCSTEAS